MLKANTFLCSQVFRIWQYHVFPNFLNYFQKRSYWIKNLIFHLSTNWVGKCFLSKENSAIFRHVSTFVFIKVAIILVTLQPCINFPHDLEAFWYIFLNSFYSHTSCSTWVGLERKDSCSTSVTNLIFNLKNWVMLLINYNLFYV
jgi:hypothetical protein